MSLQKNIVFKGIHHQNHEKHMYRYTSVKETHSRHQKISSLRTDPGQIVIPLPLHPVPSHYTPAAVYFHTGVWEGMSSAYTFESLEPKMATVGDISTAVDTIGSARTYERV